MDLLVMEPLRRHWGWYTSSEFVHDILPNYAQVLTIFLDALVEMSDGAD